MEQTDLTQYCMEKGIDPAREPKDFQVYNLYSEYLKIPNWTEVMHLFS